jgi:hypothetical protein
VTSPLTTSLPSKAVESAHSSDSKRTASLHLTRLSTCKVSIAAINEISNQFEIDDEELVRCITPNEKEDFLLISRKAMVMRTFTNSAKRNSDQMLV